MSGEEGCNQQLSPPGDHGIGSVCAYLISCPGLISDNASPICLIWCVIIEGCLLYELSGSHFLSLKLPRPAEPEAPPAPYTQKYRTLCPAATREAKAHPVTPVKKRGNSREKLGQRERRHDVFDVCLEINAVLQAFVNLHDKPNIEAVPEVTELNSTIGLPDQVSQDDVNRT
ncbi:hypothetical protein NQZ68_021710 [Dissostichus eleginoides]|nr:hypothetical protein NQZ68_021710 [Dissostichus eleginoides]